MSAHGFKSVIMVASVAGAALGCYLVSLNVASERAELERVESQIVSVERDIRLLQTEIGTRGRLAQLERWNARVIRLSAPSADQFLEGGFQLASLVKPQKQPIIDAPVIYASAPADGVPRSVIPGGNAAAAAAPQPTSAPAEKILHTAGYKIPTPRQPAATVNSAPRSAPPLRATAVKKPETAEGAKAAAIDPLSPLLRATPAAKGAAPRTSPATPKDTTTAR